MPILYDADGNEIGRFLSHIFPQYGSESAVVITRQGYIFNLISWTGIIEITSNIYTNSSCSGQVTHVIAWGDSIPGAYFGREQGSVFVFGGDLYYTPADSDPIEQDVYYISGAECILRENIPVVEMLPNDPNVTGVSSSTFKLPLRIK